jgi:hypothetical protein
VERPIKITASRAKGLGWQVRYKRHLTSAPETGLAALTYALDKALIVALQQRRPNLVFFHAAVLSKKSCAVALLAHSGVGKSTTAFAALQSGFGVASDELAPVDVDSLRVWPYPRALCMKSNSPELVRSHSRRLRKVGTRWYYPLHRGLRDPDMSRPMPLAALVCVKRSQSAASSLSPVPAGQALALAYSHCLNPMAHPKGGLPVIKSLVAQIPVYTLETASVKASLGLVRVLFDSIQND